VRVSAGSALSYATMPGIIPRLKDILFSGFGPVTQLIAIICYIARLLPKNHPSLSKQYGANYGLARVLADAANGIEFKWSNIDKIIIFAMVVCGTIMLWLYLVGSIFFLLTSPSFAAGFAAMVQTPSPTNDVAFMMLDKVFGVPGVYGCSFPDTVSGRITRIVPFLQHGYFRCGLRYLPLSHHPFGFGYHTDR